MKVGDKVRLLESSVHSEQIKKWKNNEGVITEDRCNGWFRVFSGYYHNSYKGKDLELIEEQPKLKVGDKVRLLGTKSTGYGWNGFVGKKGDIVQIKKISTSGIIDIRSHNNEFGCFLLKDVELVEKEQGIKVGDRVKIICGRWEQHSDHYGEIGEVIGFDKTNRPIEVSGIKNCTWFSKDELELVTENHDFSGSEKNSTKEEKKMEKPETKLELNACEQAKKEAIKEATDKKAEEYKKEMNLFISAENDAIKYRKLADEYAKNLGITAADKKELL